MSSIIDIRDLDTWDKQASPASDNPDEKVEDDPLSTAPATPFPVRPDLNAKICLWFVLSLVCTHLQAVSYSLGNAFPKNAFPKTVNFVLGVQLN